MRLTVSVTSADLTGLFEAASGRNIEMRDIHKTGPITASLSIPKAACSQFMVLVQKRGDQCVLLKGTPIEVGVRAITKRWILLLVMVVLLALSVWLPKKVLFVRVEGNSAVPAEQILLAAEKCGIYFGADRRQLRSVKVKNELLERMPALGWACINTSGCVATVRVIENTVAEISDAEGGFGTTICAAKDGVIQEMRVYSGFPEVAVGQAVKKGQVLISGVQKDGLIVRTVRSNADIFAKTSWDVTAAFPVETEQRGSVTESHSSYSLIFGKKRINLLKDSRICTPGCDKIQQEKYLTLPGGFQLPIGIATVACVCYDTAEATGAFQQDAIMTEAYMQRYVTEHTVAGNVLRREYLPSSGNRINILSVRFHCLEMIGRERSEEIESSYGKNN